MRVSGYIYLMVLLFGLLFAFDASASRTIGIYYCPGCGVAVPLPDPQTDNELITRQGNWNSANPKAPVAPGDIIIICNGSLCAPYTMASDASYVGGNRVPQLPPSNGGGGGGGGGPPIGGTPIGSTLVCGYVNGVLDHCQQVLQYVS